MSTNQGASTSNEGSSHSSDRRNKRLQKLDDWSDDDDIDYSAIDTSSIEATPTQSSKKNQAKQSSSPLRIGPRSLKMHTKGKSHDLEPTEVQMTTSDNDTVEKEVNSKNNSVKVSKNVGKTTVKSRLSSVMDDEEVVVKQEVVTPVKTGSGFMGNGRGRVTKKENVDPVLDQVCGAC